MIAMAAAMSIYATPPPSLRRRGRASPLLASWAGRRRRLPEGPWEEPPDDASHIACDRTEATLSPLGPVRVTLNWRIAEEANLLDWIGLYLKGETNPFKYVDYKSYGTCGRAEGRCRWDLAPGLFKAARDPVLVVFKYYSGMSGAVRAQSAPLRLVFPLPTEARRADGASESPRSFVVTGLRCAHMRRTHVLACQYYAKFRLGGQLAKTPLVPESISPLWANLDSEFCWSGALSEGALEVVVKERTFSALTKTVAQARLPLATLFQPRVEGRSEAQFVCDLRPASGGSGGGGGDHLILSLRFPGPMDAAAKATPALAQAESAQIEADTPRQAPQQSIGNRSVVVDLRTPSDNAMPILPLGAGLSTAQNSDSGISQCSQSPEPPPNPPPPPPRSWKPERPSASATESPRLRRPDKLPLPTAGAGDERGAALVLRNPHTTTPGQASTSAGFTASTAETIDSSLPQNWEARIDRHGRIFFVDHANRTTTWERPLPEASTLPKPSFFNSRSLMDQRYSNLRKTVGTTQGESAERSPKPDTPAQSVTLFLQRADFATLLHNNQRALDLYNNSNTLKHILSRVRKEPGKVERWLGNQELLGFLNSFADASQPLPQGWEARLDSGGRTLFVDHGRRGTSLLDPRLPLPLPRPARRRRPRSAPGQPPSSELQPASSRLLAFLRRPDLIDLLQRRLPSLASDPKLRRKLAFIARTGPPALQRYANDLDLATLISAFSEEIGGGSTSSASSSPDSGAGADDFEGKLSGFYERLQAKGYGQGPGKLKLRLKREDLVKDAFDQLSSTPKRDLQRNKFCVVFDEEDGLDYGGPSREFFFLLSRELFNPYYGLFEYSANDTYTVQISPMSVFVDNYIQWFYFCGRVLGLALIHRYLIDTFFTRAFYKFLLKSSWSVSDVAALDGEFHASLVWLQENAATAELELSFSVNEEVGGAVVERDLIPGGADVPVSEDNKDDYIQRLVRWRLERGVRKQSNALLRGFYEVVDPALVSAHFDARELELVLSGTVEIDIGDWRAHTEYRGGYAESHVVVAWFWQAVERFSNAQRLLLLQFVTGTSSIPYEGFSALRGSHGPKKFTLEKWGTAASLPRAHTCFNRLDLPAYPTAQLLFTKLLMAVEESSTYGIE